MTVEELARRLAESGIVDESAVRAAIGAAQSPKTETELVDQLVAAKLLTDFQRERILAGNSDSLLVGEGDFILQKPLGKGGFGQVWLAWQPRLKRQVALKSLHVGQVDSSSVEKRLLQEGQVLAALEHPNLVRVYDARCIAGVIYLVMQYIDGVDSQKFIDGRDPLTLVQGTKILLHAAKGLKHAHDRGIVHRDVKPSNLMVGRDSVIRVLDLGLARIANETVLPDGDLTRFGEIAGSPHFMAPEQFDNFTNADVRSDVYGLGCTFFFLMTGETPYQAKTLPDIRAAHGTAPIPSICKRRPDLPAVVDGLFARMVAKEPADRFASMGEVIAEIDRLMQMPTVRLTSPPKLPKARQPAAKPARSRPQPPAPSTVAMKEPSRWKRRFVLLFAWLAAGAGTWFAVKYLLDSRPNPDRGGNALAGNSKTAGVIGDNAKSKSDASKSIVIAKKDEKSKTGGGNVRIAKANTPKRKPDERPPVVIAKNKPQPMPKPVSPKSKPATVVKLVDLLKAGAVFHGPANAKDLPGEDVVLEVVQAPADGKPCRIRIRSAANPLYLAVFEGKPLPDGGMFSLKDTLYLGGARDVVQRVCENDRYDESPLSLDKSGRLVFQRKGVTCVLKPDSTSTFPSPSALEKLVADLKGSQWTGLVEMKDKAAKQIVVEFTGVDREKNRVQARMYSVDDPSILTTIEGSLDPATTTLKLTHGDHGYGPGSGSLEFLVTGLSGPTWFTFTGKDTLAGYHAYATATLARKAVDWPKGKLAASAAKKPIALIDPVKLAGSKWVANATINRKTVPIRLQFIKIAAGGKQVVFGIRSDTGAEVFEGTWNARMQAFVLGDRKQSEGPSILGVLGSGLYVIPLGNGLWGRKNQGSFWAERAP